MNASIEAIKTQLSQLKELHASGVLPQDKYDEGRSALERRILDLVLAGADVPPAQGSAPNVTNATNATNGTNATMTPSAQTASAASPPAPAKAPLKLMAVLGVAIVAIAAAGYYWKGSPAQLQAGAAAQGQANGGGADAQGGNAPHATSAEQIAAMTGKLEARLKEQPNDVEGWAMLARTYEVLQRHPDAIKAYEKAIALRKDDAALLADYADALAVSSGTLDGEPMKQLEKALRIDPKNLKALALAGTYAFNKKEYASAVKLWEKMVSIGPADNVFVKQIIPGIAEARRLAGMPPPAAMPTAPAANGAGPLDAATGKSAAPTASGASVKGTVTLSAALAKQVGPEDTVFIFARPAEGSRMPLAITRRQVKDLPIQFTLDDSMAMSPTSSLSSVSKVIVGARISKSGNAMPQTGDLQGLSAVVNVGSDAVKIEIKDAVK